MKHATIGAVPALAALLLSTSARADITADQVWQNWKSMLESNGQTVTAQSESRAGDTLTVSGLEIAFASDDLTAKGTIDSIAFREMGDGTVSVALPAQMSGSGTFKGEDGTEQTADVRIDQSGLTILASGTPEATRYDYSAAQVLSTVTVPGPGDSAPAVRADVTLAGMAGDYTVSTDTLSRVVSANRADSARISMDLNDPTPETGGTAKLVANVTALTSTTEGTILSAEQMEDMAAALASGFATNGSFGYGGADFTFETAAAAGGGKAAGTFGPGTGSFGLDKDRLTYGVGASGAKLTVSGGGIPFPELVISFAETALDLVMPVSKSDTPQDFRLLLRTVDLAVSDEVWAMFDPAAALPRDPATLIVDTAGKARWLIDLFSPEAEEMETVPGELSALDINDLTLRAVGASVTGKGAFTFDNTDLVTFEGMPAPTGKLDLTITGANALLEKLSQTGLLPQDQVMGARMMMGLFTRPGEGPDTLTSTLEFKDKGFFANGQQLQ